MLRNGFRLSAFCLILAVAPHFANAQSQSQNYVLSRSYKQSGADPNDISKVQTMVQYFDGLGRPIQSVSVAQSSTGADLVQPMAYDAFGRPARQYLPYTAPGGQGTFQSAAITNQGTFYGNNIPGLQAADLARPFTDIHYEASPLNRPLGQTAPGGRSAPSSIAYGSNAVGEVPRYRFVDNADLLQTVAAEGTYAAGTLTRTQTTDEQGHVTLLSPITRGGR